MLQITDDDQMIDKIFYTLIFLLNNSKIAYSLRIFFELLIVRLRVVFKLNDDLIHFFRKKDFFILCRLYKGKSWHFPKFILKPGVYF